MICRLLLCVLILPCLLSPDPFSGAFDIQDPDWKRDEVKRRIYSNLDHTLHCFKLLSIDGHYGCESQTHSSNC